MQRTLSVVALGLGVAVSSSAAWAMPHETLAVHVPFAFSVRDRTLPPGDYRIRPLNDLDRRLLEGRSADGRHALVVLSQDGPTMSETQRPELVFDRYGQMEYLRGIKLPAEAEAVLDPSRSELQAARSLAAQPAAPASAVKVNP